MEDKLAGQAKDSVNGALPDGKEAEARREFLKKIGTSAAAAPAVALLIAASTRKASAQAYGDTGVN